MARALWFFALFAAFFVVGMRLAGLPLAVACAAAEEDELALALCEDTAQDASDDDGSLAPLGSDDGDDAEHGSAPLMTLPRLGIQPVPVDDARGTTLGKLSEQRARASHARSVERPPRV